MAVQVVGMCCADQPHLFEAEQDDQRAAAIDLGQPLELCSPISMCRLSKTRTQIRGGDEHFRRDTVAPSFDL